jgi:polyferredoxin
MKDLSSSQQPAVKAVLLTDPKIIDPLAAFLFIGLIALGERYKKIIRLRGLFLFMGVMWFGFYRGGCSCMISSFQNLVLGVAVWNFVWLNLIWLGVLIVATYFFGRIWCGWLCYLGGIQEFLFRSPKLKILTSANSQKYLRITRYVIFGIWVLQLLVVQRNIFCEYDPFRTLFNYIFTNWISLVLLFLLLLSSVIIYRPFCRILCPVGVILGWVSKIPGARRMSVNSECIKCGLCTKECAMRAIGKKTDKLIVNTEDCIVCGECNEVCRKDGIKLGVK